MLGISWKYDRNVIHDGRKNNYTLEINGYKHMLFPLEGKGVKEKASSSILLMGGKEPLKEEEDPQFCSLRMGEIIISHGMSFTGAHTHEEVMQEASREEAKGPKVFKTNSLSVVASATEECPLQTIKEKESGKKPSFFQKEKKEEEAHTIVI
jgi:hypothetical protein